MSKFPIKNIKISEVFDNLEINKDKQLYYQGKIPDSKIKRLAIIGTRNPSPYGISICKEIIERLKDLPVCIISGLAYGIDSLSHSEALKNNLKTIAIPGSGLDKEVLYPQSKIPLANEILESGNCLISPFENNIQATNWTFPARNELIALLSDYLLIIEAGKKSGTLITADFAINQNKNIIAVPGNINSPKSEGCNYLIKEGAEILTNTEDILDLLNLQKIKSEKRNIDLTENEKEILDLLRQNIDKAELSLHSKIPQEKINIIVSGLEIKGLF